MQELEALQTKPVSTLSAADRQRIADLERQIEVRVCRRHSCSTPHGWLEGAWQWFGMRQGCCRRYVAGMLLCMTLHALPAILCCTQEAQRQLAAEKELEKDLSQRLKVAVQASSADAAGSSSLDSISPMQGGIATVGVLAGGLLAAVATGQKATVDGQLKEEKAAVATLQAQADKVSSLEARPLQGPASNLCGRGNLRLPSGMQTYCMLVVPSWVP